MAEGSASAGAEVGPCAWVPKLANHKAPLKCRLPAVDLFPNIYYPYLVLNCDSLWSQTSW